MTAEHVVGAVLWILALYHLGMGVLSVVSYRATGRIVCGLYAGSLTESPQLRYAVRMLGLYALAIGTLVAVAATDPAAHRSTIAVVIGLQAGRALSRLVSRQLLAEAFAIPPARNVMAVSMLAAECVVLLAAFA